MNFGAENGTVRAEPHTVILMTVLPSFVLCIFICHASNYDSKPGL